MLDDTDRLLGTVEQVLRAGKAGLKRTTLHRTALDFGELVRECVEELVPAIISNPRPCGTN